MSGSRQADNAIISALKQRLLACAAPRLAHDLNNDLTIIGGQAELAQRPGDLRLQDRMEQIKLATRRARERNQLIQQLAEDEADTGDALPEGTLVGDAVVEEVHRMASLLNHRDVAFTASANGTLPTIVRARLHWITGAVLMAALSCPPETRGTLTMAMSRGGGGLRMHCHAVGLGLADWLIPTLAHCATAADVTAHEQGWQALILLAEAV